MAGNVDLPRACKIHLQDVPHYMARYRDLGGADGKVHLVLDIPQLQEQAKIMY